jgi:hypothetical protein
LLSLQSLAGKPDVEAVAAKPQEDSSGCCHLLCKSSAFGHKATSSLLVKKPLIGGPADDLPASFLEFFKSPKIPQTSFVGTTSKTSGPQTDGEHHFAQQPSSTPLPCPPLDQMISFPSQGNKDFFLNAMA